MSSHTLNLWGVLSQSKRIINAHSRHFLALSVSFLLPLSFSLIIFPTLQSSLFHSNFHPPPTHLSARPDPSFLLVYTLFALLLSLLAVATITYSTFHGFYGRPVKLVSSINSLLYSFLPLLSTIILARLIQAVVVLLFPLFLAVVLRFLGLQVDYDSNWFVGLVVLSGVVLVMVFIWLQVNWSLAYVIVVVESKWGYEPLRRSAYLVKGMRWVALSVLLFFGLLIGLLVGGCSSFLVTLGAANGGWWTSFGVILQLVVSSGFATLLMLQDIAASVVLYMYCKALHGELALDIAEEFAREYVYLPFDNEKVPHVVCVVQG